MDMVVKETPVGNCVYCEKCTQRHDQLEKDAKMLCRKWGIDVEKLEREERQHLNQLEKKEKKDIKKKKRKANALFPYLC